MKRLIAEKIDYININEALNLFNINFNEDEKDAFCQLNCDNGHYEEITIKNNKADIFNFKDIYDILEYWDKENIEYNINIDEFKIKYNKLKTELNKYLKTKVVQAENINEYDEKDVFIEDKDMTSMEELNELSEADIKLDRCTVCKYNQLKRKDGFKICPRCNTIFKLLNGKGYLIYTK